MEPVSIRTATANDIPQVRTVIAQALADDPMIRWLIPMGTPARLSRVAIFFSAQVERLVTLGHTDVAVAGQDLVGAAMWIAPDSGHLTRTLPQANDLASIVSTPERVQQFVEQFQAARQGAQSCSAPYLATLGVSDSCRGQGVGSRLIQSGHDHFGSQQTWLESTNPANISLYQRAGYTITHEAPFADATTVMTQLIRTV